MSAEDTTRSVPEKQPASLSSSRSSPAPHKPNLIATVTSLGAELGDVASSTVHQMGKAAASTASGVGEALVQTSLQTGKAVLETTVGVGEAVTNTASQTGKVAVNTALTMGGIVEDVAAHSSRAAIGLAKWMGTTVTQQTHQWLEQTTQGAGRVVDVVGNNWFIRKLSGVLKLDWLVGISDNVDVQKATATVRQLQQKHPNESPSQIAHRLMLDKAAYAGGMGLITSLIPGQAAALLAVDLAATAALQTEMVYQIAAAYGLDLNDPARKGELLAIYGLALGGGRALKAGLGILRNLPMAGAIIGASTNATMLYALGYAACRFYEAKLQDATAEPAEATLEVLKAESDRYLELAIIQQTLMDQILVHMITASYPAQDWQAILPKLAALQLSPASLEAIASSIRSPQPLDDLLNQLNRDYAVPLLAQCYRIAKLDGTRSPAEDRILEVITNRFNLNLDDIQRIVDQDAPPFMA